MATTSVATPSKTRFFLRYCLPWLIIAGGIIGCLVVWLWPSEEMERYQRVLGAVWIAAPLTFILLAGWVLIFSGWRWQARWGLAVLLPAVLIGAFIASVREHRNWGDMLPQFRFFWQASTDDAREAHRQQQGKADLWVAGDLSGKEPGSCPGCLGPQRD